MKKKIFTLIFFMFSILWISVSGAQEGRYVRKKLPPNFFVPKSAVEKPEKLPEFNRYPLKELQEQQEELERKRKALEQQAVSVEVEKGLTREIENAETDIAEDANGESIDVEKFVSIEESKYVHFLENSNFSDLPAYKQKYIEYINALNTIAETGIMPKNEEISKDLAKMNTNMKIFVDEDFGL